MTECKLACEAKSLPLSLSCDLLKGHEGKHYQRNSDTWWEETEENIFIDDFPETVALQLLLNLKSRNPDNMIACWADDEMVWCRVINKHAFEDFKKEHPNATDFEKLQHSLLEEYKFDDEAQPTSASAGQ